MRRALVADAGARLRAWRARPWSLRTRLVVSAVVLIAVVAAVIGTVTTIAFRSYLYEQADGQLQNVADRAAGPPPEVMAPSRGPSLGGPDSLRILSGPGSPLGTLGAVLVDGELGEAAFSTEIADDETGLRTKIRALDEAQRAALADVPRDGWPHTAELPGLGDYRIQYALGAHGEFLVGTPLTEVEDALSTLIVVEVSVTGAGLVAASLAGTLLVRIALRPLRRVAATATQVAGLPLHSGEPALHHRVPEADPRTEVGQVGAAINRMLDHVHSALHARQQSETRVRQFVADASHELRTPLASIRGYAELTRRGREECGPDTRHALGRIESEAVRMTGLVEDLLLLARLDAGRPLAYRDADLSPLVVDAVSDARAAGQEHGWRLELPDEPVTVRADSARLHQVLVNLLSNARTHTPPGTLVTARVRTDGDGWVVVEIEDDGPGIPAELLPHVFERFARGDHSRSRHAGSTGLGLAIVRAVVAAHGGEVTVASAPGRTVFSVRLPSASYGSEHSSQAGHRLITQA
ncbi:MULTISPECIES: sensor histidine kinase [Streptomyces]|uniref:histidine kinase n=1 Tax=Streptomyces solicathayae TaxID=3081768 RepID=A0ABZ0LV53_9ACTN|nr:HAMP domain-containing sensor histidine kinase [Streptomyces sp. HUAS YS2]WOX23382.1 HAMP domain-containing sensor histidine kinase [Streptomyces sp. HUAS YS2]